MSSDDLRYTMGFILLVIIAVGLIVTFTPRVEERVMRCEEDEVIVGQGDYDGREWGRYECVPLDDLQGR